MCTTRLTEKELNNYNFRLKLTHVADLDKLQQQFTKEMQEITKTLNEEKQQQLATLKKKLDTEQVRLIFTNSIIIVTVLFSG